MVNGKLEVPASREFVSESGPPLRQRWDGKPPPIRQGECLAFDKRHLLDMPRRFLKRQVEVLGIRERPSRYGKRMRFLDGMEVPAGRSSTDIPHILRHLEFYGLVQLHFVQPA